MKNILLITEPRTGSTTLMRSIASAYNFTYQFEPDKRNKLEIKENHLVKIIIDVKRGKSYYLDLIKKFDKTILLSRRNIKEQCEAFWALMYLNGGNPLEKWSENQLPKNLQKDKTFREKYERLREKKFFLLDVSEKTNLKINYYEDVFKNKSLLEKDIKLDLKYFGPQYKLRIKGNNTIL